VTRGGLLESGPATFLYLLLPGSQNSRKLGLRITSLESKVACPPVGGRIKLPRLAMLGLGFKVQEVTRRWCSSSRAGELSCSVTRGPHARASTSYRAPWLRMPGMSFGLLSNELHGSWNLLEAGKSDTCGPVGPAQHNFRASMFPEPRSRVTQRSKIQSLCTLNGTNRIHSGRTSGPWCQPLAAAFGVASGHLA